MISDTEELWKIHKHYYFVVVIDIVVFGGGLWFRPLWFLTRPYKACYIALFIIWFAPILTRTSNIIPWQWTTEVALCCIHIILFVEKKIQEGPSWAPKEGQGHQHPQRSNPQPHSHTKTVSFQFHITRTLNSISKASNPNPEAAFESLECIPLKTLSLLLLLLLFLLLFVVVCCLLFRRECEQNAKYLAFKEAAKCVPLGPNNLPSICMYTLINTHQRYAGPFVRKARDFWNKDTLGHTGTHSVVPFQRSICTQNDYSGTSDWVVPCKEDNSTNWLHGAF